MYITRESAKRSFLAATQQTINDEDLLTSNLILGTVFSDYVIVLCGYHLAVRWLKSWK